jgi:transposase
MQDVQLYEQLLGLVAPWKVEAVSVKVPEQQIEVRVACQETVWGCPQCSQRMHVHEWEERRWRHLDSCQFQTILVARVPRVRCPEHGSQVVAVPWAEKFGRFTRLFERLAIQVLQLCSVAEACRLLRISWEEADGIKQRAVDRGLARKPVRPLKRLCVDEKTAGWGQDYVTVVAHVTEERTVVEYVGDGREQASLDQFWTGLTSEQLTGVEAVAMDMWEPYFNSTCAHLPGAAGKIVYDPYHLVQHMNEAVNHVRKQEHRRLAAQGDAVLAGTRSLWLYGMENVPEHRAAAFDQIKFLNLATSRAWALKEVLRNLWLQPNLRTAQRYFERWYSWAIRCRLAPVKKVARMCRRHLANILTYFEHRLTNGPIEGLNNRIQGLVKKAFGYRNRERFKRDILFHLGDLDLYPAQ